MKQLVDFLPVVAFFGVYVVADIYWATVALMVAAVVQVAFFKLERWNRANAETRTARTRPQPFLGRRAATTVTRRRRRWAASVRTA